MGAHSYNNSWASGSIAAVVLRSSLPNRFGKDTLHTAEGNRNNGAHHRSQTTRIQININAVPNRFLFLASLRQTRQLHCRLWILPLQIAPRTLRNGQFVSVAPFLEHLLLEMVLWHLPVAVSCAKHELFSTSSACFALTLEAIQLLFWIVFYGLPYRLRLVVEVCCGFGLPTAVAMDTALARILPMKRATPAFQTCEVLTFGQHRGKQLLCVAACRESNHWQPHFFTTILVCATSARQRLNGQPRSPGIILAEPAYNL